MRSPPSRYLIAVAAAALALGARALLSPLLSERLPFSTVYAAVAATVWLAGWRAALLTAVLGYLSVDWLFVGHRGTTGMRDAQDVTSGLVHLITGGIIITFGHLAQSARDRDRARVVDLQRHVEERDRLLVGLGAAERREREAHHRLQLALDAAGAALAEWDPAGRRMTWDEACYRMLGYEPGAVEPGIEAWIARLHPEDRARLEAVGRRAMAERRPVEAKYRLLLPDGTVRWVHSSAFAGPAVAGGGTPMLVSLSFDITRRKVAELTLAESERALRAANAELSEADRRKDEFLAMLAHELRNPLGAIGNSVQLLRRAAAPEPPLALARDIIGRQVTHLTRLIDDLLDVSRVTQGKITLQHRTLDLRGALSLAIETARADIEARRQRLAVVLPPGPVPVLGDAGRLAQVFGNLLGNASKFSEAGGPIRVSLGTEGREAVVVVSDEGTGIPAAMLPRIFEVFVQGDQSLDRSRGGLGIGLALARALVELHGGTIRAHSDGAGRGSRFEVRLPSPGPVDGGAAGGAEVAGGTEAPGGVEVLGGPRSAAPGWQAGAPKSPPAGFPLG